MVADAAAVWTRETPWRQGNALRVEDALALGLAQPTDESSSCVIVISHDCDLANDNLTAEPNVEVIVGRHVTELNGNFSWAKSPRTLHLPGRRGTDGTIVELVATAKRFVPKSDLAKFSPDVSLTFDRRQLGALQSWLAARYRRAAFPDSFNRRMKATGAEDALVAALKPHGTLVSTVHFDVDGGAVVERGANDPYILSAVLVFDPSGDAEQSADAAEQLAATLETKLRARFATIPGSIELRSCLALSEDDITVGRARNFTPWRLEHLSHKDDDQAAPVEVS